MFIFRHAGTTRRHFGRQLERGLINVSLFAREGDRTWNDISNVFVHKFLINSSSPSMYLPVLGDQSFLRQSPSFRCGSCRNLNRYPNATRQRNYDHFTLTELCIRTRRAAPYRVSFCARFVVQSTTKSVAPGKGTIGILQSKLCVVSSVSKRRFDL